MRKGRAGQDGYALLVIMLALSVLILGLAKAVPSWKTEIRRERESRMLDHARQYRVAIRRYYHANGRYPASIEVLLQQDAHGTRYLRGQFLDPLELSEDGQFQALHYGQSVADEIVDQPPAALLTQISGFAPSSALGSGSGQRPGQTSTTSSAAAPAGLSGGLSGGGNAAGAGPVIGVVSRNKQPSVHSFNGFDTPDHWQFVYNFATDRTLRAVSPPAPGAARPGLPRPPL